MAVREVAILDLWTDSNRGDEALQAGLIQMLRRRYPDARLAGVFRFGTNEFAAAAPEVASTVALLDGAVGGIRRTYYAAPNVGRFTGPRHTAVSMASFLEALACIACFLVLRRSSRAVIGPARYRSLRTVRDADVVVWKGKNFRDYRGMAAVSRAMTLGAAGWFAGLLRPRIHCVNASFWRIEHRVARYVYRQAFRRCRSLTVRDAESVDNARAVLGERVPVHYCADLSFGLFANAAGPPAREEAASEHDWDVALTITAWGPASDQARYVEALTAAVTRLCELGAQRFVVVPQVSRAAEDSSHLAAVLAARLQRRGGLTLDVIDRQLAISDLREHYARCRMLIGSRMHSCVFARSVDVPFVALAYDAGPKWGVLASFWDRELIVDYGTDAETLVKACETVWIHGAELVAASADRWRTCVAGAYDNLRWLDG